MHNSLYMICYSINLLYFVFLILGFRNFEYFTYLSSITQMAKNGKDASLDCFISV